MEKHLSLTPKWDQLVYIVVACLRPKGLSITVPSNFMISVDVSTPPEYPFPPIRIMPSSIAQEEWLHLGYRTCVVTHPELVRFWQNISLMFASDCKLALAAVSVAREPPQIKFLSWVCSFLPCVKFGSVQDTFPDGAMTSTLLLSLPIPPDIIIAWSPELWKF